jgi:adenine-specific DNA-methyltransferase
MSLLNFDNLPFIDAVKAFFQDLKVPVNYVTAEPTSAKEILKDTYKDNETFRLTDDVFFVGMVDDAAFEGNASLAIEKIKSDYDGILIFGVSLKERINSLLPTRAQLAEITRAFNREFYYTPVVVVFKYGHHVAFANTERLKYKQEWREGEKAGKVSLLRDINIEKLHPGHERILSELKIPTSGSKQVDSFAKLYIYWQEVFSVSLLNKKFYQELSVWYFWAIKNVTFPGAPTLTDAHLKNSKLEDLQQEHKATNVIRMLTRLLFVWFIKEKKLIPEELFELDSLQQDILNEISPYHETGMFKETNKDSVYYKTILQNLFFATLNCPIDGDSLDKRKRGFRGDGYGTHRGIDYLMRYKQYFKNPDKFLETLNNTVPFLNGGLFECLDDKFNNIYIDGFSDNMTKGEQLIVPDYLFFGIEEETDISDVVGIADKKYQKAAVKGLINILKSYKFTITENTPIEEDVELDPELLGKVFENLLASYNPETKTSARKQTGSFYTPREIVNYMVDESLMAYLKNAIKDWGMPNEEVDGALQILTSYDSKVPFADQPTLQKEIITALSRCTILDPACGSGAFPMGILQKMVHLLQKLDPENKVWKEVQLKKAEDESKAAFEIEDKQAREDRLLEINEAFDQSINDPDYARKLYLIETCIYGVDLQPIATQISKLRFFISLVVEQKVNPNKINFGIRPLPNLETKFVAANTLIGIEKPSAQLSLYDTTEIKLLEIELKKIRHKLFSARSKDTKLKYRSRDEELRTAIATELEKSGWKSDTAQKLAGWDPYDQNASSPFFDPEWMFDVKSGFDVVIGNPPYVKGDSITELKDLLKNNYKSFTGNADLYIYFIELGIVNLSVNGVLSYITPNKWIQSNYGSNLRAIISKNNLLKEFLDFGELPVFKEASTFPSILILSNIKNEIFTFYQFSSLETLKLGFTKVKFDSKILAQSHWAFTPDSQLVKVIASNNPQLKDIFNNDLLAGIKTGSNPVLILNEKAIPKGEEILYKKIAFGKDLMPYGIKETNEVLFFPYEFKNGKNVLLPLEKFEKSYSYFLQFKNQLTNRAIIVDGVKKGNKKWYELQQINRNFDYNLPKIIYPDISSKNKFVYDESGIVPDMTCFFIPTTKYEYVPIFNSLIFRFLAAHFCPILGNYKEGGRIRFKSTYLEKIPVPVLTNTMREILRLLSDFLHKGNEIKSIEKTSDAVVFNLYFPAHMKERGIDVLEFVERDIMEVMQSREFETLGITEKEHVISALNTKWSHPNNEVRNRIKLFAVRSPEFLKPILES